MSEGRRLHALDSLRGMTLLSMICYHGMWDLVYLFGISAPWYLSDGAALWQQSICMIFITLSGFCHALGHHPVKRGLQVFGVSLLISTATLLFMPEQRILWGVLSLLGLSMLLCVPLNAYIRRIPPLLGAVLSVTVFLLLQTVQKGYLSIFGIFLCRMPEVLYANDLTALLGFPPRGFYSTDYFPLLPWFFLFLCGRFLFALFERCGWISHLKRPRIPFLSLLGRHSLLIYTLHQPLLYVVLYAIFTWIL
ncbi:MAG: DUF1624 domain-containing protein [Clostridia bacterium]|nr:DUF1624 domain-containing protein [Clostridia bacterium]